MLLERTLEDLARRAITDALGCEAQAGVRPASPAHGDYQINGVLPLAKTLGKPPRELATKVAERLRQDARITSAEVAGPGFVNLRLRPDWLCAELTAVLQDRARDGVPAAEPRQRVVVDYSGPNIAKQMHVGHLRSTIIGDALCRVLRFLGHEVTGDNHLGDFGTQFGLLIVGMRELGSQAALDTDGIDELERVYKLASARAKQDEAFAAAARAELAKLQRGDADNRALWEQFVRVTRVTLDQVYERLGVRFDLWRGESAYEPMLPAVVARLRESGIARDDQGALCVFFEADAELGKSPLIVQKQDGAYLYATTDLATLLYRRDELRAERALYVVDARQALHFKQLFAVARRLGLTMELSHVSFGSVLGTDGKPLKTRDGQVIRLGALLDEAVSRAAARMRTESGLELTAAAIDEVAKVVGIGAVKYADLMQNRTSDYVFDWDKMISLKGNAGPYLQYAHARIRSILRKGQIDEAALRGPIVLDHEAEFALGKQLLRFGDVVHAAGTQCAPHLLCEHLYALARAWSAFFESCPVLRADTPAQRDSRLALASLCARQLARGLSLLGIAAPDRM